MSTDTQVELSLMELEKVTGVTARTIRYYISKKLLPGPFVAGPGATYGQVHLDLLNRIGDLKKQGLTLDHIRAQLEGGGQPVPPHQMLEPWLIVQPTPDVTVMVRAEITPWRRRQIDMALGPFVQKVSESYKDPDQESEGG